MEATLRLRHSRPASRWSALLLPAALALLTALLAGCGKSPEEQKAERVAEAARTTGGLLVKSNLAIAEFEATHLNAAGELGAVRPGAVNQPLAGLAPGKHAIVVRAEGWPELVGSADITAGQTTEVVMDFKIGALHLESVPNGATVKLGKAVIGQTPMTILQLPAGETEVLLEYPAWPPLPFKATIVEGRETSATARLPHGRVVIDSSPAGATVLDGRQTLGRTPLTIAQMPAGTRKLTLQAEGFPPVAASFTLEDGAELKIRPELGLVFPPLDPNAILRDVWMPDDPNKLAPAFDAIGKYEPRNSIVKNLHRRKLHEGWMGKRYRFTGVVTDYDRKDGHIEFGEDKNDLTRYRVIVMPSKGALAELEPQAATLKGTTLSFYGQLSAVEEPRWPAKVITFELSAAELLRGPATP